MDVKSALFELLHETEYVVGIRPDEKLHETLINEDEWDTYGKLIICLWLQTHIMNYLMIKI